MKWTDPLDREAGEVQMQKLMYFGSIENIYAKCKTELTDLFKEKKWKMPSKNTFWGLKPD